MRPVSLGHAALAFGVALLVSQGAESITIGQPTLTPNLEVLPVNGFRVDVGMLSIDGFRSQRSGRRGDLWGPYLAVAYGAARNAVLCIDGMVYKQFDADGGGGSSAVGDFFVWGKFILGEDRAGERGYGVRFGAKLPNTPSNKDFGTNQTDFFMHVFAGTEWADWDVSAYSGIGILERPGGDESQDDVAMIGVEAHRPAAGGQVTFEIEGFGKSRIYGDNWGFHTRFEHPINQTVSYLVGAQFSKGRLYGTRELRAGLVLHF